MCRAFTRRIARLGVLLALLCGGCSDQDAEPVRRLYSVEDGVMRDPRGNALLLRGVNFSGAAKGTEDHLFHFTDEDVQILLRSGLNSVRLLTFWKAITPDAPGVVDPAYLSGFLDQVERLAEAGLYVVVDMHQDLWGVPFAPHGAPGWACPDSITQGYQASGAWWTNYATPQVTGCFDLFWDDDALQQAFADAWVAMASAVCGQERVVGFDLLNEPYPGSALFDAAWDNRVLMPFYERLIQAIEAACPGRLYFVEHSAGFVIGLAEPLVVEQSLRDRVVYAGHFYPQELHEPTGGGYDGDAAALAQKVWRYVGAQVEAGTAVWGGEYGGMTDANDFAGYIRDLHAIYAELNVSTALWDYGRSDRGFLMLDSEGLLKPGFEAVFLTPTPTLLPSPPVQRPRWEDGAISMDVQCSAGRQVKVLVTAPHCHCQASDELLLGAFFVKPLGGGSAYLTAACLAEGALTVDCACSAP